MDQSFQEIQKRYNTAAGDFGTRLREAKDRLAEAKRNVENPSAALQDYAAEQFRTGQAGAELKTIQLAVDAGTASWPELMRGHGDPALVSLVQNRGAAIVEACRRIVDRHRGDPDTRAFTSPAW
jgi:hypothetical protein